MSSENTLTVKATRRLWVAFVLPALLTAFASGPCGAGIIQGGETISSGAAVTASSETYGPAVRLVDGLLGNGVAAEWLPADGASASITVDLGRLTRLSDLNLLNSLNFSDRSTANFNVQVSTNGAFAGEQGQPASGVLQAKGLGWQDVSLPSFTNPANNALLVGRYVRINALTWTGFGPGLAEASIKGVPNRGTGALAPTNHPDLIRAQAYTRTPDLQDLAPVSWALRRLTPTSASIVQSLNQPVTATLLYDGSMIPGHIVNGINDGGYPNELIFAGIDNTLSEGTATIDLGQEMIIDRIDLLNSLNFGDRGTSNYIVRVGNDPAFADGNACNVVVDRFTALDQTRSHVLAQPVLGRYVRFIASDRIINGAGIDEVTVYGRTFTAQTIATGTDRVGDSSRYGRIELATALPIGTNLLALQVSSDVWSSSAFQAVNIVAPAGTLIIVR